MDINYTIVGAVVILTVLLIIFLIRRNRKDEKDYEKEVGESEIKADQHDKNKL